MVPVLWDAVRYEVDMRGAWGQLILIGSAVPKDDKTFHTGTGRISRLKMRTMSLFESKESNGTISLKEWFNGKTDIDNFSELTIEDIAYAITREVGLFLLEKKRNRFEAFYWLCRGNYQYWYF